MSHTLIIKSKKLKRNLMFIGIDSYIYFAPGTGQVINTNLEYSPLILGNFERKCRKFYRQYIKIRTKM